MTKVRIFDPPNRLAKIVQGSEGVCFDELVAASEDRIELMKDQLQIYVRDQVRRVVWFGSLEEEIMFARCAELGQAAMNIADVAGAAHMIAGDRNDAFCDAVLTFLRERILPVIG